MRRKFKIKLLLIQILTLIPFLIFTFYIFDLWYDTRRELVLEENLNYARATGEIIHNYFQKGQNISKVLSNPTVFIELYKDKNNEKTSLLLKNILAEIPEIYNIHIADINGRTLATTIPIPKGQEEAYGITDREYFKEAIRQKKTVVSTQISGKVTDEKIIVSATPIIQNGEVLGIIVTGSKIELFKKDIENLLVQDQSNNMRDIILLDKNGDIAFITGQSFPNDNQINLLSKTDLYQNSLMGKAQFIDNEFMPVLNTKVMGASVPINSSGWTIVSIVPSNTVFTPLTQTQNMIWIIICSALVFSVSASSYFLRKVKVIF